jgi:hypothetical protein
VFFTGLQSFHNSFTAWTHWFRSQTLTKRKQRLIYAFQSAQFSSACKSVEMFAKQGFIY